jgi:cbb3-type cytochrome oxidase subunit 3
MANLFKTVTYLVSLMIWCWAFRPAAKQNPASPAAATPSSIQS